MKLATPFKILNRLLNLLNDKEMNVENTIDNYMNDNYWDQECLDHPTNNACLIYCD